MLRIRVAVTIGVLLATVASAQDAPPPMSEDHAAALAWLEKLGVPDIEGRPFVRLECTPDGDEGRSWTTSGFLLEDTGEAVSVVGLGMTTEREFRSLAEVRVVEVPLADFVDGILKRDGEAERHPFGIRRPFEGHLDLPPLGELGFLAWACRSRGLDDRAEALLKCADALPSRRDGEPDDATLLDKLRSDLDTTVFWRTLLLFQDRSKSRPEILAGFRHYLDCFPAGAHRERAATSAELLEHMIRQDEERAASRKPWDEMSEEERIADLIYQLRDQPGGQHMQPGAPYFYRDADHNGGVEPPIARLEKMGSAAVPQLIDALDDPEFTRCIGFHRDFYFSHYVQRVGDAALSALSTIADTRFYRTRSTSGSMWKDGDSARVRAAVEDWWREYREKGELQLRIEQVREGAANCRRALAWLIEHAPEQAAEAAREGLRNAPEARFVSDIVQELRALKTDASTELLVAAMDDPRAGVAQTYAAIELMRRGVDSAFATIEREWDRMEQPEGGWDHRIDGATVAGAYLMYADLERLREIAGSYARLGDARRSALVTTLERGWIFKAADATRQRICEDILLAALDDHVHTSTAFGSGGVREMRRSDDAAQALLRKYDDTGIDRIPPVNVVDREAWLLAVRNAVRAKRGLPAVAPADDLPEGPLAVGDVLSSPGPAGLPTSLRDALEECRGAPVDRDHLGRLLDAVGATLTERGGFVRVAVSRHPGRLARIDLTYDAEGGSDGMWRLNRFAQVGPNTVQSPASFGTTADAFPDETRSSVLDMLDRALGLDDLESSPLYLEFTVSHR